jgi:glycosyltransferase involved in cell wall biosynthesis
MKYNVLYVSPNGFVGGAEAFVLEITKSHLKNGNLNIINLFFNDGDALEISKNNGIETVLIQNKFKLSHLHKLFKAICEIRKILKDKKIDIIHSTMPYAHIVMSLASFGLGIKKVWFQHGPVGGTLDKIGKWLKVNCVMYNSEFLKEEHDKLLGFSPTEKDVIIPLGIDKKDVVNPEVEDLISKNEKKLIIGVAGRINRFKGYHIFIEAVSELSSSLEEEVFKNCVFPIIGGANSEEDKKYLVELKQLVEDKALQESILFLGHKSNINDYLNVMDVFLHCSPEREAISIVAAEAMLQNTLVIGSGIDDIVIHDKTGIECNTNRENAHLYLKEKILEVIRNIEKDDQFYNKIKKNAYDFVRQNYSKEAMTNLVEKTYMELLDENPNNSLYS